MSHVITLKGDVQGSVVRVVSRLFGLDGRPTRQEWWLVAYASGCAIALLTIVFALAIYRPLDASGRFLLPIAALAIAAAAAEKQSVRLSDRGWISVTALPIVLAAVVYGPLAAIVVTVASLLPSFGAPYARWATWTSTRSIAAGLAGLVALAFQASPNRTFGWIFLTAATVMAVEQLTDLLLGSMTARRPGIPFRQVARHASAMLLAMPLYVPVTALLVFASSRFRRGAWRSSSSLPS